MRLAAIDIGTVTTRLLVADLSPEGVSEVERSTDITHLGQDLSSTGRLAEDRMVAVANIIAGYAETISRLGVTAHRAIATSASRDAANGEEFMSLLAERGIQPEIVPGHVEAELAFLGATSDIEGENLLVVDCGGGSTELVFGDVLIVDGLHAPRVRASRSIDVGSRRMTELFLRTDPPARSELDDARKWAAEELRGYFDRLEERPRELLALAGTATTLAAIRLEMAEYDATRVHGYKMSGSDISDVLEMLAAMPLESRKQVVGLHPGRASVIVAGALIFETVLALAGLDTMTVSEHDILYGILLDTYHDLREEA